MSGPRRVFDSSSVQLSTLTNGIRVVTETVPSRVVSLGVWVEVGARDEHDLSKGCSHFVEHLLFKGTKCRNAYQIARELDLLGGTANAFTAAETTCYYATVLSDSLPRLVDLLSDIVFNSCFTQEEVEHEREVILQEIAMVEDNPEDLIHDLFNRLLWGSHPLGNSVLGPAELISALSAARLRDHHRRHYRPSRIIVAAAGQVDHLHLCRLWSQNSADIRDLDDDRLSPSHHHRQAPKFLTTPQRRIVSRPLEQAHLLLGTYGLAEGAPEHYALQLLNTVLGGNMSSRLFQEIREKRGLAYAVYSYLNPYSDSGVLGIYLGVDPKLATVASELALKEISRLRDQGLSSEELTDARAYTQAVIMLAEESMESRMSRLARNLINFGRPLSLAEVLADFERVSLEDVQAVAKRVLSTPLCGLALGPLAESVFP